MSEPLIAYRTFPSEDVIKACDLLTDKLTIEIEDLKRRQDECHLEAEKSAEKTRADTVSRMRAETKRHWIFWKKPVYDPSLSDNDLWFKSYAWLWPTLSAPNVFYWPIIQKQGLVATLQQIAASACADKEVHLTERGVELLNL